ncbi:hypothetical protein KAK06_08385 [Ideonella sp. 4Y11]|uniref:DUF4189 domain-containing protein n=1 Tax=Ideonella aquatica TaxID=2824119 RepID=A0A940YTB9_9BURK|nr:hypothetical protein [Ideonella aquatica]MBQ0958975.1 hypothetical protein [Ideonella aquatica]
MKPRLESVLLAALLGTLSSGPVAAQTTEPAWTVAGRQGLVRQVIVPTALAKNEAAYQRQIAQLCGADETCFLNFYTNSTGAEVALPLPDAIANEATATWRRSMKNGARLFTWSCRLQVPDRPCF